MEDQDDRVLSEPELEQSFPYDDRPFHPTPEEDRPLERLAGRGQTEGTPMGLGKGLSWAVVIVVAAIALVSIGGYVLSLLR